MTNDAEYKNFLELTSQQFNPIMCDCCGKKQAKLVAYVEHRNNTLVFNVCNGCRESLWWTPKEIQMLVDRNAQLELQF